MNDWTFRLMGVFQLAEFWWALLLVVLALIVFPLLLPQSGLRRALIRGVFWLIGAVSLLLGIIGIVLPVLPTTPFVLLTAACWARASPGFYRWLWSHRYFGKMVQNWEERRAVPRRAKWLASVMMTFSCISLFWRFPEQWWLGGVLSIVCFCTGSYLWQRPDA